jgi:hypothetical protein
VITNFLPYIFGIPSFLGGLYLFLISFKIYRPKQATEEQKMKFDNWAKKYGTITKIGSIIMILSGGYDLIVRDTNRYKVDSITRQWTSQDREVLVNNCMRDSKETGSNYPEITREYCECSMDKIIGAITIEEYEASLEKSIEEQKKEIMPLFKDCLTRLWQRIDSVKEQRALASFDVAPSGL